MENKKRVKGTDVVARIVIVGVFAALCYITLLFNIRIPTPGGTDVMIHLGNMVCVLGALLFGGIEGGLAGSIGMGLFDLFNGWAHSAPKTFILKFGIGIVAGLVMYLLTKREGKIRRATFLISSIGCGALAVFAFQLTRTREGLKSSQIFAYIMVIALAVFLFVMFVLYEKMTAMSQKAAIAACAALLFNAVGEYLFKLVALLIAGTPMSSALTAAFIYILTTLLNGAFSIIGAVLLYIPLRKALISQHLFKLAY